MAEHDAVKTLDYKGLACPMPVVRISQEIGKIGVGEVVEVHTTDPGSMSPSSYRLIQPAPASTAITASASSHFFMVCLLVSVLSIAPGARKVGDAPV